MSKARGGRRNPRMGAGEDLPEPFVLDVHKMKSMMADIDQAISEEDIPGAHSQITKLVYFFGSITKRHPIGTNAMIDVMDIISAEIGDLLNREKAKAVEMKASFKPILPYRLGNVDAIAHEEPSFEVPPKNARLTMAVGDFAKLLFKHFDGTVERMWVRITDILGSGTYDGVLDSASLMLERGIPVTFTYQNVLDITSS